jgi:two-component system, NarL family, invasion response regulator UvrY
MSGLPEQQYARNVLRAGASGYLPKAAFAFPEESLKAVWLVLGGRRYVSSELAEAMAGDLAKSCDQDQPLHASLASRELQVFTMIANGVGISAIATELSLSVKTVSTYRTRIFDKTGFAGNSDITAFALRNGLIQWGWARAA